jgi:hypothetical protein
MAVLILAMGTLGCASNRVAKKLRVVTDTWSVLQISDSNEFVVVAKGGHDLRRALESMGCNAAPCSIGRLGDVYSVTTFAASPEESTQSPVGEPE